MSYSVLQLKTDLTGVLHGTNLNKIQGVDQMIYRAAREVLLDVDPQETKRTGQLDLLYDEVWDIAIPSDVKGNKIIDIFPQSGNRNFSENPKQSYNREFDLFKGKQFGKINFSILHDTGVKTMRIDNPNVPALVVVNDLGAVTSNGTWTVFDDAFNLQSDTVIFAEGSSSLRFDLDGTGTNGGIEIDMDVAVDLSDKEDIASLFEFMYLPNASGITSIGLRWGSSSSDYWEAVSTVDASSNSFQNFWNRLKYLWNADTTEVGTPDASDIKYLRVNLIYDGNAQSGIRADRITTQIGEPYNIEYYSKYLFSDSTGAFQETVTSDDNTINLDTETYNLLFHKVAQLGIQQQADRGSGGSTEEIREWKDAYRDTLKRYKSLYKSEIVKPQGNYYRPTRISNRRRGANRN